METMIQIQNGSNAAQTVNKDQFFDFDKAKVQTLTLDQLERTHKENDVYNKPLRGIYHYDLINQILQMCEDAGYKPDVYDLFAAQNKDRNTPGVVLLPQVEAVKGTRAVEAHILRRVFANVHLTDFDDDTYTTNIAIAFHQKGIQVGFGNMVKICHNQCMLGASNYIATYSDRGKGRGENPDIPTVLSTVKGWLAEAHQRVMTERQRIETMKQIEVSAEQCFIIIGMLTAMRVKVDTHIKAIKENTTYPLNQSQISKFTESLLVRYNDHQKVTAWDVYNAATDLYKADTMDIPALLPQNRAMVNFLATYYHI